MKGGEGKGEEGFADSSEEGIRKSLMPKSGAVGKPLYRERSGKADERRKRMRRVSVSMPSMKSQDREGKLLIQNQMLSEVKTEGGSQ